MARLISFEALPLKIINPADVASQDLTCP